MMERADSVCATVVWVNHYDYSAWIPDYEGASEVMVAWRRIKRAATWNPDLYNDVPGVPRGGFIGVMVRHKPTAKILRVTRP